MWCLAGITISSVTMLAISFCIFWMRSRASLTFSFLPVITITSFESPSAGRSILVCVSSRIFLMFAPPLPMMYLWNCLKIGTSIINELFCSSFTYCAKYLWHRSTSSFGPRIFTISDLSFGPGNTICTWLCFSRISRIDSPLAPMIVLNSR
uniref:Putative secreted protein n=1 Tax=Anopheles darlingi TaxID=43151 RepID=A0A2M4D8P8_ANODA